jgi:hypothetical protein
MGTQQEIAKTVQAQDADSVLSLQGHQETWYEVVAPLVERADVYR